MSSVFLHSPNAGRARTRLKAYSAFEPYELTDYLEALAGRLPDISIEVERMATATLTQRLLTETPHANADLILGWADSAARTPALRGLALARAGTSDGYARPTGFSTALVVDTRLLNDLNIGIATWRDLARPALRGRIAFPDPVTSGAGFLALATLIQGFPGDEGWDVLEAICRNVSAWPGSAWQPAAMCGGGEIVVGVTVRIAARKRTSGPAEPHLALVEPQDACGVEAEVYGVLNGTQAANAAGRVVDWVLSNEARALFDNHHKINLAKADAGHFKIDVEHAIASRGRWLNKLADLRRSISELAP
jgi:iron(III) transport system substrate-binding protein